MARRPNAAAVSVAAMVLAALGVAVPAASQTSTDDGVWTAVSLRGQLSADAVWRWTADSLVQSRDGVRTVDLATAHIMVTRRLGRRARVGLGYALGAGFRNTGVLLEHRLTQLFIWSGGVHTRVSIRTLLEERFITGRNAVLLRARPQVRLGWPLAARQRLRGVLSGEVLVQTDFRAPTSARLDGSRWFAGIGLTPTPAVTMEIGYMKVDASAGSSRRQISHVLSASFAVSLLQGRR